MNFDNPELLQSTEGALNGVPRRWEWSEGLEPADSSDTDSTDDNYVEPTSLVQVNGELRTKRSLETFGLEGADVNNNLPHPFLSWLSDRAGILLMPILPLLWCGLLVFTMDRQAILSAWAMPLLGIGSATLANAVPVGGGIVFVPALQLFGVELKLGAAFAVATMTFGNGVFGFLSWLRKDPKSIAWSIVPYALLPAWAGATITTLFPFLSPFRCQQLFAGFCLLVASIVARSIYIHKQHPESKFFSIHAPPDDHSSSSSQRRTQNYSLRQKVLASICSFLAGSILVAHIGIGNAMTTFLVALLVWNDLPAKACVVTGILVGGWTSIVPFLLHLFVIGDVPIALWVMGLPGVYLGARIAPLVHDKVGLSTILTAFCVFLVATAALMLHAAAGQR